MTLKRNVSRFNADVLAGGGYVYTGSDRYSAVVANQRLTDAVHAGIRACEHDGPLRTLLDVGCGDGVYTAAIARAFPHLRVCGFDPAGAAIEKAARDHPGVEFRQGNILDADPAPGLRTDIVVLRGVLHHLSDAAAAIRNCAGISDRLILIEPNGWNLILKGIERFSAYHREHEERSFTSRRLTKWCDEAGYDVVSLSYVGFIPFFFPTPPAKLVHFLQPALERLPLIPRLFGACAVMLCRRRA